MGMLELVFGILLTIVLVALSGYFAWRQIQTRRVVAQATDMPVEERGYLIRQTRRRLLCSLLMLIFAGLLVAWFFIEPAMRDLRIAHDHRPGTRYPLLEVFAFFWIGALFVLFGIFALAGMDFFATARHAMEQRRLLEGERRATLQMEVERLRRRRGELN